MSETSNIHVLENGWISRRIDISGADVACTSQFKNLITGRDFLAPGAIAREFAVRWRGHWLNGCPRPGESPDFLFVRATDRIDEDDVSRLDLFLTSRDGELQVQLSYLMYADLPLIRKKIALTNAGSAPGAITGLAWEDLPLTPGGPGEVEIIAGPDAASFGGSWIGRPGEAIAMAINRPAGEAYVVANEAPGIAALLAINAHWTPRLRVKLGPSPGGRILESGQTWESPCSAILLLSDLTPEAGASRELRDYVRRALARNRLAGPPIVYCTNPSAIHTGAGNGEARIQAAAGAGILVYSIEGGGMRHPGGFEVDIEALPGGLGPVSRRLEELDIGLGVSLPLAALDADAPVVLEHPDWLCLDEQGKPIRVEIPGETRVMACMASGYRHWLADQVARLCAENNVAFVHFTGPAALIAPGGGTACGGSFHHHTGSADAGHAMGEALLEFAHRINEQAPDLMLGFDHNLWGADQGADLSILQACDFIRICEIPDTRDALAPLEARRLFYRRARLFPAECLAIGSLRIDGPNPVAALATALAGFPMLYGEANRLTSGQIDWLRLILTWRRTLARAIDFHERFYLLQASGLPRKGLWDGYAKLSRGGEGYVGLFRNFASADTERIFIPGLWPDASYRLESVFRDRSLGIFKGAALAADGLSATIPMPDGADLIEVRRVEE